MHQDKDVLMLSLSRFFNNDLHIRQLVTITSGGSNLSLRMIDWFITSYSKKNNVIATKGDKRINVYHSYTSQLRTFSKHQFDPFRRHQRIVFHYDNDQSCIETTVGQLNFFRWAIETGVLDYILSNRVDLERSMSSEGQSESRAAMTTSAKANSRAKRAIPTVHHRMKTRIMFD